MQPKTYQGKRLPSGETRVTVDGQPLRHVDYQSPDGFNWGYEGSGPADLALSILADHFGETDVTGSSLRATGLADQMPKCWHYHQAFKRDIIAGLSQSQGWQIDNTTIDQWLKTEPPPEES